MLERRHLAHGIDGQMVGRSFPARELTRKLAADALVMPKLTLYHAAPSRLSIVHWMLEEVNEFHGR
jgi:hypothetical protein